MKSPLRQSSLALASLSLTALFTSCTGGGDCGVTIAIPPPPGTGVFGDLAFELRQDVNVGGSLLTGAVFQDFDGDGLVDIAELSNHTSELRIGRGLSDGTFLNVGILPTPAQPWSIEAGDYNGDGRVDLAVGSLVDPGGSTLMGGGQLSLYLQDEFSDFILTSTTPLAGDPFTMARLWEGGSDLDAVGQDDLLIGVRELGAVQQLRLEGGVWTLMATLMPQSGGLSKGAPLSVTTIDMDGDADLDVVVGEFDVIGAPHRVVAYTNDGMGGFFPASLVLPALNSPIVANQGDVDGDGFEDLAISELGGTGTLLLHGSAAGLMAIDTADFGGSLTGAVWSDFDGDGIVDVAAARVYDQAIGVRFGLPSGGLPGLAFGPATFYNVGYGPHDLTLAYSALDSLPDLMCANSGDVSILHNRGDKSFLAAKGYHVGDNPRRLVTGDLDQDGDIDVITLDMYQKSAVFMAGQGDGTFVMTASVALDASGTATPGHAVIRDFDEDGLADVLVSVYEAGDVRLMRNPGSMLFGAPSVSDVTMVGSKPLGLDAADFNSDGHWDVLVANSYDESLQLLLGDGTGSFATQTPIMLDGRTMAVYAGDLNGDGFADAVVTMAEANETVPRLKLFQGDGLGNLVEKGTFPLGSVSSTVEVGDLNADGLIDLVFGQSTLFTDEVTILMNQGNFGFIASTLVVGPNPGSLTIADIDDDGNLDLVVPIGSGELRLALGDGTGGFPEVLPLAGSQFSLPVPYGTNASTFADVNGDGLADLIMLSPYTSFLWVARNLGSGGTN